MNERQHRLVELGIVLAIVLSLAFWVVAFLLVSKLAVAPQSPQFVTDVTNEP